MIASFAEFRPKLSAYQAAKYLGLGKSTLDKLRLTGGGPRFASLGRRIVYDPADLDFWVDARKRFSTSEPLEVGATGP